MWFFGNFEAKKRSIYEYNFLSHWIQLADWFDFSFEFWVRMMTFLLLLLLLFLIWDEFMYRASSTSSEYDLSISLMMLSKFQVAWGVPRHTHICCNGETRKKNTHKMNIKMNTDTNEHSKFSQLANYLLSNIVYQDEFYRFEDIFSIVWFECRFENINVCSGSN